jgi:hypothetical protein
MEKFEFTSKNEAIFTCRVLLPKIDLVVPGVDGFFSYQELFSTAEFIHFLEREKCFFYFFVSRFYIALFL